jgi:hypothetical protein
LSPIPKNDAQKHEKHDGVRGAKHAKTNAEGEAGILDKIK